MSFQSLRVLTPFCSSDPMRSILDVVDQCVILRDTHMVQISSDCIMIDDVMIKGHRFNIVLKKTANIYCAHSV